jgi:hypothetical protein
MRRWALLPPVVVVVMVIAAGCIPAPPSNPMPARIDSVVVAPGPVVAGAPFTVSVTASDESIVSAIDIEIRPPVRLNSAEDPPYPHLTCDAPPFTAGPVATRVFTCTLPAFVPNGAWRLTTVVRDQIGPTVSSSTFDLVGGSDDNEPPVVESTVVSPNPVVVGQPFSVTIRISDDHLSFDPQEFTSRNITYQVPNPPPQVEWSCGKVTPTQVSPTVEEFAWTGCLIGPPAVAAQYGGFMQVFDAIGHKLTVWPDFDVVAAP